MTTTGLRELRQRASELVRQAEAGQIIMVSVSGRHVAELGPVRREHWRQWADVAAVFDGPTDSGWDHDRDLVDHSVQDPFSR